MLRISKLTDYASVILQYLSLQPQRLLSANKIAQEIHIATPTVRKVLKILLKTRLVVSEQGVVGGYKLAKDPHEITVAQVISAIEGNPALTECAKGAHLCAQDGMCAIQHNWQRINLFVMGTLANITLADMSKPLDLPTTRNTQHAE